MRFDPELIRELLFPSRDRLKDRGEYTKEGTLAEVEANYMNEVLAATKGNKTEAARILGISRKNLYERIARQLGLNEQLVAEVEEETDGKDKLKNTNHENSNP